MSDNLQDILEICKINIEKDNDNINKFPTIYDQSTEHEKETNNNFDEF